MKSNELWTRSRSPVSLNLNQMLIHLSQFATGTVIRFDFHKYIKRPVQLQLTKIRKMNGNDGQRDTHYALYIGRTQKNTRVDQKWYSSFGKQFNIHQRIYPAVCTSQKHIWRKITIWIVSMMYALPSNNHTKTHLKISVRCKLHPFFRFLSTFSFEMSYFTFGKVFIQFPKL